MKACLAIVPKRAGSCRYQLNPILSHPPPEGDPVKRAALYLRVSTLEQNPETQGIELRQFAHQRGAAHFASDDLRGVRHLGQQRADTGIEVRVFRLFFRPPRPQYETFSPGTRRSERTGDPIPVPKGSFGHRRPIRPSDYCHHFRHCGIGKIFDRRKGSGWNEESKI